MTQRRQRFAKIHTHLAGNSFGRRPSARVSAWSRYCFSIDSWTGIVVHMGWWIVIVGAACQEPHQTTESAAVAVQKNLGNNYLRDGEANTTTTDTAGQENLVGQPTRSILPVPSDTPTATSEPAMSSMVKPDEFSSLHDPDERFLHAFRLVFCAQKRGDQESVFRIWNQLGYTSASWADAVQDAVKRAANGTHWFGYRWAEIRRVPCP